MLKLDGKPVADEINQNTTPDANDQKGPVENILNGIKVEKFLFVRSLDSSQASVRLHICAAEQAASNDHSRKAMFLHPKHSIPQIDSKTCIVFYYADKWAVETVRFILNTQLCGFCVCFGSDIKTFSQYDCLEDIVDCFLMPSDYHRKVLGLRSYAQVRVVREAVDPNAYRVKHFKLSKRPSTQSLEQISLVWFGYPENFYAGMSNIIDIIRAEISRGRISKFAIVTKKRNLEYIYNDFEFIDYNALEFSDIISGFDYAVLSHYPGDLTVNAFIKSHNKAIASLMAGTIPIVTNTPNYKKLMESVNLEEYIYSSPTDFASILSRLNVERDYIKADLGRVCDKLLSTYSPAEVYKDMIYAIQSASSEIRQTKNFTKPVCRPDPEYFRSFISNFKGLLPSFLSLIKRKFINR